MARQCQYSCRQYKPIRHDDEHIGRPLLQRQPVRLGAQLRRLRQRNMVLQGEFFDDAGRELAATPSRPIWLGQYPDQFEARVIERQQGCQRKLGGSGKGDTHGAKVVGNEKRTKSAFDRNSDFLAIHRRGPDRRRARRRSRCTRRSITPFFFKLATHPVAFQHREIIDK